MRTDEWFGVTQSWIILVYVKAEVRDTNGVFGVASFSNQSVRLPPTTSKAIRPGRGAALEHYKRRNFLSASESVLAMVFP